VLVIQTEGCKKMRSQNARTEVGGFERRATGPGLERDQKVGTTRKRGDEWSEREWYVSTKTYNM
jgi:hypothetical protein